MMRLLALIFVISIVSGCAQKPKNLQKVAYFDQAKLIDIPLPLGAEPIDLMQEEDPQKQVALTFIADESVESLVDFYSIEMEKNGWKELGIVNSKLTNLNYLKPRKFVSISLKVLDQSKTEVTIFEGVRKSSKDHLA